MVRQICKEMPKRVPINGTFELTVRCNLHCKMCLFRHDDKENPELMEKELTKEQWIDMAKQVAKAGTMNLLITGGEPMLRPDFCEIWEGIYKQGFIMELYTNATLVTSKIMETLQKYPPHKIGITVYGASPETYERVCGDKKAFQRAVDGILLLQELPSVINFRTTLIKDNMCDSEAIDLLLSKLAGKMCKAKQACPINKAVRGACADVSACRIPPEQDIKLKVDRVYHLFEEKIGESFEAKNLKIKRENIGYVSKKDGKRNVSILGCQAGMSQYTISYDGKLFACQMIGDFYVDVLEHGFENAWIKFPSAIHIPYEQGKCGECEYVDTCQACYGTRYAETGDFNGCSQYIYELAKIGKEYEEYLGGTCDEYYEL